MNLFYSPCIQPPLHTLGEEESNHITRVLRLKTGAELFLTDGKGTLYRCEVADPHPKFCHVKILSSGTQEKHPYHLHIAMAPTKNINRFEWFLEKATEIGIDEITPLICEHSERTILKASRLNKVLISAMKQSLKCWLPKLNEPARFTDFISNDFPGRKFIAWCETGEEDLLAKIYSPGVPALLLIGPEGDFSATEIEIAKTAGFIPISLGRSRLRTETAGVVACVIAGIRTPKGDSGILAHSPDGTAYI
jgi:16S rRNA (uracil1498-N3)-methyltransferase